MKDEERGKKLKSELRGTTEKKVKHGERRKKIVKDGGTEEKNGEGRRKRHWCGGGSCDTLFSVVVVK